MKVILLVTKGENRWRPEWQGGYMPLTASEPLVWMCWIADDAEVRVVQ